MLKNNCHSEFYLQSLSHEESQKSKEILRMQIQRSYSQNDTALVGADSISARQYGITLIALVITIVVLFILAGIIINFALSEGGILGKANLAKEKQEVAEILDKLTLAEASTATNYLAVDLEKYKAELKAQGIAKQDDSNYIASADGLSYELTSDKGYVFTVTEPTKGDIVITYEGKEGKLSPKIIDIKAIEKTASSIKTQVNVTRLENGTLSYYYKKQLDTDYITFKENTTEKEVNFTGLTQNQIYTIKVVAKNSYGKSNELVVNVIAGELQAGTISQKGTTIWTNGQASIELQTTMPSFEIQYQMNSIDRKWLKYTGAIAELKHNDIVYARLWDGMNGSAPSSIQIIDEVLPQDTIFTFNNTVVTMGEKLTVKVEHKDDESGIEISKCKWALNISNTVLGTEEANYTGTFTNNPQTVEILTDKNGTFYLHVLTIDKAGNKKETVSEKIMVEKIKVSLPADGSYSDLMGVNTPKLGKGMIPVKWDENTKELVKTQSDTDWYDYDKKKWANAITTDGSYWVWIPRYAYQIADGYHTNNEMGGTINVEFMKGTTNESSTGRTTFQNASGQGNWNIHPAFEYGGQVSGIWVAKFEASQTDSGINQYDYQNGTGGTSGIIKIQPSVNSWRNITIVDMYTRCLSYNKTLNSHQMKNTEWGAVAYLSKSKYGKQNVEVGINECNQYITGMGPGRSNNEYGQTYDYNASYAYNTTQGLKASTTENVYGVYDMRGGSSEYVAAYLQNGSEALTIHGTAMVKGEPKTKDIYESACHNGLVDTKFQDYDNSIKKYGDAIYETSTCTESWVGTWGCKLAQFPYFSTVFFFRGGNNGQKRTGRVIFI